MLTEHVHRRPAGQLRPRARLLDRAVTGNLFFVPTVDLLDGLGGSRAGARTVAAERRHDQPTTARSESASLRGASA